MRKKNLSMSRKSFSKILTDQNQNQCAMQDNLAADFPPLPEMDIMEANEEHLKELGLNASSLLVCKPKKKPEIETENLNLFEAPNENTRRSLSSTFVIFQRGIPTQPPGKDYINMLSDEIILYIFSMLPRSFLVQCSAVCKRWQGLSYDESLWRRYDFGKKNIRPGTLAVLLKRGILILRLTSATIYSPVFTDSYLNVRPWHCNLRYLDLSMATISPQCLADLLSKCRSLKKLSVENCTLNEECCSNIAENELLEVLNTTMCEGLTATGLQSISICCKNLKEWSLAWTNLSDTCFESFVHCLPQSLRRLNLSGHRETLTDAVLKIVVKRCRNLKELDISDCPQITNVSFEVMVKCCQNLQHLHTSRSYNIPTESNKLLKTMKHFTNLEIFQTLTDRALSNLRKYMPDIAINQHMFSTIARPTVGLRRTSIWEIPTKELRP